MRVVRAILGRFARFLVRIARTLDPASATAPHWVMPERMAALRQRYPGAPEHWLEFVARRTPGGEPTEPHAPSPEPDPPIEAQTHSRPRDTQRNWLGVRARPVVVFPRTDPRPNARPNAPLAATRAAPRPGLTFSTQSVRNPIANLLRIGRRERHSPVLQFHADAPVQGDGRDAPEPVDLARHEHQTFFPNLAARPTHRPDMIGANDAHRDVPAVHPDPRWPARPDRAAIDAARTNEPARAVRPDPGFGAYDPRWPELPRLAVEYGPAAAPSLDEAILLAEQIGGAWSG